jgi:NAD(P)-dependent dehydrogenase (short-subunit alcohol dehydrogenase family)
VSRADPARSDQLLAGQTLLVIGGSSGIGLETARRAHHEGARVIVTAREPERVQRAGLEIEGSIAAFDATDFGRLSRFFDELPTPIDHVLVTGPGSQDLALTDLDVEAARRDLEAHLLLPLQVGREAAAAVRPGGSVLLTGCTDGRGATAGPAFMSAITAALSVLTRRLASELAPIRVNVIAAGFVDTPGSVARLGERLSARRDVLETSLPIRRILLPADIAALAVHLMTNTAITGATFEVDGGQQVVER